MSIIILGIESSCDDTSAAVIRDGVLLSNVIASQEVHAEFGGVVPELASRAHQQNIVPVVDTALKRAGVRKDELTAIGFTRGPGLLGSLLVGFYGNPSIFQLDCGINMIPFGVMPEKSYLCSCENRHILSLTINYGNND